MKASVLASSNGLIETLQMPQPKPAGWQVLIRVHACALCRTDLHVLDGDLPAPKYPLVLGHEVVGVIEALGDYVEQFKLGDRLGVPWLASTCLKCAYCLSGRENLCNEAMFTGYTVDGGFSQFMLADSRFCFRIPDTYDSLHAAPLLCAGLIGWRSLKFTSNATKVGIYGFGAAAHVIAPIAIAQGREIFAFTSPGDTSRQDFARSLGAVWAGGSDEQAPEELDAAILFAPVGALVPLALKSIRKGGTVVCGGIHMSDIPAFPYQILWGERSIRSVANLTREDGNEFFEMAARVHIATSIVEYSLDALGHAISDFRNGKIHGAAVLVPEP